MSFEKAKKLRIALLSWESLHTVAVGGVAVHVSELAAALCRRGHEVHVFARMGEGQSRDLVVKGVFYHRCPIDIHPDFVTEMDNMCNSLIWHLAEYEAMHKVRFDIIHGHDWLTAKGVVQAKNDHLRPCVMTIHSTEFGRSGNIHSNGAQSDRVRWVEREGTYCADRVIAVSGALADEVKWQYEVPEEKLRVVHNGIKCEKFDKEVNSGECRKGIGVGPMDPMVLFCGRMNVQKGPDLLVESIPSALANRPDAKFVFVGGGEMRPYLEHRAWQLGVSHSVRFLGVVNGNGNGTLVKLFKSADAVCVPSRNEPFGIVVLEAWASKKPVVATQNGGPREFVSHGHNGYLVYDHPGSIGWGLSEIFNNLNHAKWMGERGRVTAAYGFNWDVIAAKTEQVYREML